MKLTITYSSGEDCSRGINFTFGNLHLSFHDGEPEDNNLGRNFNSCYSIKDLVKKAYEAGKSGESLEIEEIEDNDD